MEDIDQDDEDSSEYLLEARGPGESVMVNFIFAGDIPLSFGPACV